MSYCPTKFLCLFLSFISFSTFSRLYGQTDKWIEEFKNDVRGPYKDIKWFCEDGTIREARDPCPEPLQGVQHARYKDKVEALAERQHIFLDQILTGTEYFDFWDGDHQQSRLKQYQITNFLYDADNGWILQKAKNYRGAKQIEDEQEWGQEFLEWIVNSDQRVKENFLIIRLAAEDVPHGEDNRVSQRVRAYSKLLADLDESFMDIRIKIHNNPSREDIALTEHWKVDRQLPADAQEYYNALLSNMEEMHRPFDVSEIRKYIAYLPKSSSIRSHMEAYAESIDGASVLSRFQESCLLLKVIRDRIYETKWREARVKLIDLSNHIEDQIITDLAEIETKNLVDIRDQVCFLLEAIYGAGYVEAWEYEWIEKDLSWLQGEVVSVDGLEDYRYALQKLTSWSTQMIQGLYAEPVQQFSEFEPLTVGFTDDKIRSSLILPLGRLVEKYNALYADVSSSSSSIMGKSDYNTIQGLNPGLAKAQLEIIPVIEEGASLDKTKIYAFDRPPSDLKPVSGILNVQEGNPVSHVQLLARNLAIPNALISADVLTDLEKYSGEEVFYAVSPKGSVVLKSSSDMSKEEKVLFKKETTKKDKVKIAVDKLHLAPDTLLDLSKIDASYSGKWCGPKAANLGQLKKLFPDHVVDGVVIPFGVFKDHMQQEIPEVGESYWTFLTRIFRDEQQMMKDGVEQQEIECVILQELGILRAYIEVMPLKSSLVSRIESAFSSMLGRSLGQVPVFLRSDTNMEDLPEFTGAGLNLTLFNVLKREDILNGIKKVWASPYTERSYQWRQQYLQNPEDVYPSILIIPSVNVDRSGVIITKGVSRGGDGDISISFSRGVGGAVDGQSAESYVIYRNGVTELINPGRETQHRTIPSSGGSRKEYNSFYDAVLSDEQRSLLKQMADKVSEKMTVSTKDKGPYDIELGIKNDKIWLFQVRPFVENKSAKGSAYLHALDPDNEDKYIDLDI